MFAAFGEREVPEAVDVLEPPADPPVDGAAVRGEPCVEPCAEPCVVPAGLAGAVVLAGVDVVPVVVLVVAGFVVLAGFVEALVVAGFAVLAPVVLAPVAFVPVALALPAFVLPAFVALESGLVLPLWARPDAGTMHNTMTTAVPTAARATTGENARNIGPMLWSVSTGLCEMDHGAGRSAFCGFPDREASSTIAVVPGSIPEQRDGKGHP